MKELQKILIPTDLSEHSRRALAYGCWLASEKNTSLIILHVTNELTASEFYSDEFSFLQLDRSWPVDRVLSEASLDLSRFLEASMPVVALAAGDARYRIASATSAADTRRPDGWRASRAARSATGSGAFERRRPIQGVSAVPGFTQLTRTPSLR